MTKMPQCRNISLLCKDIFYKLIKQINTKVEKWTEDLTRQFSKEEIHIKSSKQEKRNFIIIREVQIKMTIWWYFFQLPRQG